MATVVNNTGQPTQAPAESTGNSMGLIIGALLILAIFILLIFYGLPALRQASAPAAPSVTVPEQVDVNVQTPEGQ